MRIYLIAGLILIWILWWRVKRAPDEVTRRKLIQKYILYGLIGVIFILAVTGRIHWLGAAFAALIPILKMLFTALLRFFPALAAIYARKQAQGDTQANPSLNSTQMDAREAREILGVLEDATIEDIQTSYKKQMQKVHPDRGGSEYFATKLNEARDLLLKDLDN